MRHVWMFLAVAMVPAVMAGESGPQLKLLATLEGARPGAYIPIAFSPDGKVLACGDFVIPVMAPESAPLTTAPRKRCTSLARVKVMYVHVATTQLMLLTGTHRPECATQRLRTNHCIAPAPAPPKATARLGTTRA